MFGAVVLRDIPKNEVRIDLYKENIVGGFRGFYLIPFGLHYVSVKCEEHHSGFWFNIKPYTAVVKVFDSQTESFLDADEETTKQFSHLALSGSMGNALHSYPIQLYSD